MPQSLDYQRPNRHEPTQYGVAPARLAGYLAGIAWVALIVVLPTLGLAILGGGHAPPSVEQSVPCGVAALVPLGFASVGGLIVTLRHWRDTKRSARVTWLVLLIPPALIAALCTAAGLAILWGE